MTTQIINLYGGPGIGKSTTAAALFTHIKLLGKNVELVREYVKEWAWQNRKPGKFDQIYILGKQIHSESILYGEVDYVVTDSPFLLGPYYEQKYHGSSICLPSALEFYRYAEKNDIVFHNYILKRHKPFNPKGRFETEEQARLIDQELGPWLKSHNITYQTLEAEDSERVKIILGDLKLNERSCNTPANKRTRRL